MTDARNLAERVFAVIDGQRWDDYETVMQPDVEMISPFATLHGTAEWMRFSRGFAEAMPDGRHSVTTVLQDGDRFAFEGSWSGTHTGPLAGPGGEVPATGRKVTLPFCAVGTQRDGRLAAVTIHLDQLAMLAQLGLVPAPEPARAPASATR
jgi:predicted ester cyclase